MKKILSIMLLANFCSDFCYAMDNNTPSQTNDPEKFCNVSDAPVTKSDIPEPDIHALSNVLRSICVEMTMSDIVPFGECNFKAFSQEISMNVLSKVPEKFRQFPIRVITAESVLLGLETLKLLASDRIMFYKELLRRNDKSEMKSLMSSFFQKSYFITGEGCCSSFEFLKGDQLIAGQQRFAEMVDIELKTDVGFRSLVTFLAANEVMQARIKSHIFLNCKDKTKYEFTYEDMCDFCGKIPEKHYLFVINCPNTCCAPNIIWPELNLGHDGDYPFKTYLFSFIDTIQFTLQLIELQGESTCEDSLFHELNHACHYALGMRILSSDFFRSSPKHPFIADFMFNNTGLIKAYLSDIIDCILNGGLADDQLEIFEQNVREVLRGAMSEYVLSLRTDADGTEIYDPIDVKSECFIGNLSKHVKDDGFATELKDFLFLYIMGKLFDYVEEVFNIYGFLFVDDILYINMLSDFDRNFELNCSLLRYPYMGVRKSSIEAGVGKAVPTLAFSANAAPSVEDISEWIEFYCEYHIINHCIPTKDALPTLKILHGKS